jgi:hypothetical protein
MTKTSIPSADFVAEQLAAPGGGETIIALLRAVAAVCRADKTYATDALFEQVLSQGAQLADGTKTPYYGEFSTPTLLDKHKTAEHQAAALDALGVLVSQNRKYAKRAADRVNSEFLVHLNRAIDRDGMDYRGDMGCAFSMCVIDHLASVSKHAVNDDTIALVARHCMRPYKDPESWTDRAVDPRVLGSLKNLLSQRCGDSRSLTDLMQELDDEIYECFEVGGRYKAPGMVGLALIAPYHQPSKKLFKKFLTSLKIERQTHAALPFYAFEAILNHHPKLAAIDAAPALWELVEHMEPAREAWSHEVNFPSPERIEALQRVFQKQNPGVTFAVHSSEADRAAAAASLLAYARKAPARRAKL